MNDIKYRNEIKYLCTEQQLVMIEKRIENICKKDKHVGESGEYLVRSVYFDDYEDSCYYENIDGVNQREKFRIRIYNGDMSFILLECKSKLNGKNHKDSCRLTKEQCEKILQGNYSYFDEDPPVLRKFILKTATRFMRPKVIVQYVRTPYTYDIGNVRITFDRNISASAEVMDFGKSRLDVIPVMQEGYHILEVKYDELLPDFLRQEIQTDGLLHTAFSKYVICRKAL